MNAYLSPTAESNLFTMGIAAFKDDRQQVPPYPYMPNPDVRTLRARLCGEEAFFELCKALGLRIGVKTDLSRDGDKADVIWVTSVDDFVIELDPNKRFDLDDAIDACCDGIYVLTGTLCALGVPDKPHLKEVCERNNAKFPGGVGITDANGKYQKPEGWTGPDHAKVRQTHKLDLVLATKVIIAEEEEQERERQRKNETDGHKMGQIAYEAYCKQSDGKSHITGATLPPWNELAAPIKAGWDASADAVATTLMVRATMPSTKAMFEACEGKKAK